jgi:hypothetical protein
MTQISRRQWLAGVALAAAGCGRYVIKPPTPAAQIPPSATSQPIPGEHFYVTVFGSQSIPKVPRYTHTWATVVHLSEAPGTALECHTISWMPATLDIRPWIFRVEPGVNLDLHSTIKLMLDNRERVSQWGPYECRPRLYERLLVQKAFLESGRIGYQCIDTVGEAARKGNGSDCIHAISDSDPIYDRTYYRLSRFGEAGSEFIVEELMTRNALLSPQTLEWLNERLGLTRYPIVRRTYLDSWQSRRDNRQRGRRAVSP